MSSVRQLAKLAGVSPSTVSRVLRNAPYVRADVRERVLDIAARLAYHPHTEQAQQRCAIGCIVPTVSDPYSARLLGGIAAYAYAEAYRVIVMESHSQLGLTCQALHRLQAQQVAGVLLFTGHEEPIPSATLFECWSRNVALVKLAPFPCDTPIDAVYCENGFADSGVAYLQQLGHRRILIVGQRFVANAHGLHPRFEHLSLAVRQRGAHLVGVLDSEQEVPEIIRLLKGQASQRPTAIMAEDDAQAARVLCALLEHGVRVPHDVSLLGCGNHAFCEHLAPRLTSLDFQPEAIGRLALDLVLRRAATTEDAITPEIITVNPTVVVRESCAPPRL